MPRWMPSLTSIPSVLIVVLVGLPVFAALYTGVAAGDGATWDHILQNRLLPYTFTTLLTLLIAAIIISLIWPMPALQLAMSVAFMFFSSAVILYQTSEIIHGGERNYILATITLYVSLYNIFMSLLHLLMAFSGDD